MSVSLGVAYPTPKIFCSSYIYILYIMNVLRYISSFDKCKNPLKVIGMVVASTFAFFGVKEACGAAKNWFGTKSRTKAAKELEDQKHKNAMVLEEKKTEELRKRLRDKEEHFRNMGEIRMRQRLKHRALSQQAAQEQGNEGPSQDTAPSLVSSEEMFGSSRRHRRWTTGWLIDGYAKPGQITMLVACADVGKSSLLAQTALAVANGKRPEFLPDKCSASLRQDVVFYRIEDFSDELEGKYGQGKIFMDANIQWVLPEDLGVTSLTAFLAHVKRLANTLERDTLVCADPVTKLDGFRHETCIKGLEEAQRIAMENDVTLSFIVAAHHDEIKDWKHLTTEDIKGGDKGVQQAGSVIALRMEGTPGGNHRFIQCLKAPKGHAMPFPEGVLVCKYVKSKLDNDNWYLHFEYVEIKPETDARPEKAKVNKAGNTKSIAGTSKKKGNTKVDEDDIEKMVALNNQGRTYAEIVEELSLPIGEDQVGRLVRAEKAKQKPDGGNQAA